MSTCNPKPTMRECVVKNILDVRVNSNGSREFHVTWTPSVWTSWESSENLFSSGYSTLIEAFTSSSNIRPFPVFERANDPNLVGEPSKLSSSSSVQPALTSNVKSGKENDQSYISSGSSSNSSRKRSRSNSTVSGNQTEEKEFIVERILKKRKNENGVFYLVKWLGYNSSENTWEPENHVSHLNETRKFEATQKSTNSKGKN